MKQQCQNRGISRDMSHRCGALGDPGCTNLIMCAITGDRVKAAVEKNLLYYRSFCV
jgi:hypothetical protein